MRADDPEEHKMLAVQEKVSEDEEVGHDHTEIRQMRPSKNVCICIMYIILHT